MLTAEKLKQVHQFVENFSAQELIWLSGYLTGMASGKPQDSLPAVLPQEFSKPEGLKITIAYGTESGNSKKLATGFALKAKNKGIQAKVVNLSQYRQNDLLKEEYFIAVISTQGDGEPPESAKKFYDFVQANTESLDKLTYGVLALGDTSYPLFCKAGEDIDSWLDRQGASRLVSLQRCDTDYAQEAETWFSSVLDQLASRKEGMSRTLLEPSLKKSTGRQIYEGEIIANINLNDRGSAKQTHHIEIASENVLYAPGDSLGIVPENPSRVLETILALTGIAPEKMVQRNNESLPVSEWLKKRLNIIYLSERVVKKYAAITGHDIPDTRIGLHNLLKIYPVQHAAQFEEVLEILETIIPRLYSISSSPALHENELHLTVALEKFSTGEEDLFGLCSDHLVNQSSGNRLNFYIHSNQSFKLPDSSADIIMIGPGTGIAPFRSFLAEREAQNAEGRNWLFFGDQHFNTDFLYQTEIQNWHETGLLTNISLAFSRDQAEKIYVQHKMLARGAELYDWIERGAFIYVCGAREPMAADVESTLLEISSVFGKQVNPAAWLENLNESGRYLKDVY